MGEGQSVACICTRVVRYFERMRGTRRNDVRIKPIACTCILVQVYRRKKKRFVCYILSTLFYVNKVFRVCKKKCNLCCVLVCSSNIIDDIKENQSTNVIKLEYRPRLSIE